MTNLGSHQKNRFVLKSPYDTVPEIIIPPGHLLTITDASGTTFHTVHAPGIYWNLQVPSFFVDGSPAYPVIIRVLQAPERLHPSRPEA